MRSLILGAVASSLIAVSAMAAADGPPTTQASVDFLAANAKKPGVVVVPGIQYRVLKHGKGAMPSRHDCATVDYKGMFTNGRVFDASKPGSPVTFPVGGVIAGWTEALQMMHEGDMWELTIPAGLAYGKSGTPDGTIPGGQTLVFDVTLLKVSPSQDGQCAQ
jgi:FKBP-type peptidyl-prolyl cis-trans isomerase FklB